MEYNSNGQNVEGMHHYPGSGMATAAMLMGVVSVLTLLTVYLPLILGSIAILLAILSKGYGRKLLPSAKVAIATSIGSVSLICVIIVSAFSLLMTSSGDTLIKVGQQLDQQFESQTGGSLEDIFGESYEDIMKEYVEILGK